MAVTAALFAVCGAQGLYTYTHTHSLTHTHTHLTLCHGSQALCVATLGSDSDAQRTDSIRGDAATDSSDDDSAATGANSTIERFYLQYYFPPSSVGEVGRVGPAGVLSHAQ